MLELSIEAGELSIPSWWEIVFCFVELEFEKSRTDGISAIQGAIAYSTRLVSIRDWHRA
jgi:hypothetical protein